MMALRVFVASLLFVCLTGVQGSLIIEVLRYPARIYTNAPPGIPVLNVDSYDNVTKQPFSGLVLSTGSNSTFFKISSDGVISTKKRINLPVGTLLQFFVFGAISGKTNYKHVKIIVSRKNLFGPRFLKSQYRFTVYRFGVNSTVGTVHARDPDTEYYNRQFKYSLLYDTVKKYFTLNQRGEITLIKTPLDILTEMKFTVAAVDMGSPPLKGQTSVHISISEIRQPSAFCFSTQRYSVTICWKNPMKGHFTSGYIVEMSGGIQVVDVVQGDDDAEEICHTVTGTQLEQQYYISVWLRASQPSPDVVKHLVLNTTGIGFTPECIHYGFDACNYLKPCANGGQCQKQGASAFSVNYQCSCPSGWTGKNCTAQDMCHQNPCLNKGSCHYISHNNYSCDCVDNFYGQDCQRFNVCSQVPCQHGGHCSMLDDGKFSCACSDHYSGINCETPDPCKPNPCLKDGLCVPLNDTAFDCQCKLGFYGEICDEMNPCLLENICQQNGTCVHTGNNTFVCECRPGTTGERCTNFDPCSLKGICANNATCYLKTTGTLYGCRCLPGYYGGECQHYDKCYGAQCGNGTCKITAGSVSCECHHGYYGAKCEFINTCLAVDPCGNRGRCENTTGSGYLCHCLGELYGQNCTYVNSCKIVECQNGGTCESSDPNMYACKCPEGFYDDQCGSYNPCVSSPCQNGGSCTNTSSYQYSCGCTGAFYGSKCERRDPCFINPCQNGASCSNVTDDEFSCSCTSDFAGRLCHLPNPCLSDPCLNNGVCSAMNTLGSRDQVVVNCSCNERFTGEICETRVHPCSLAHCDPQKRCQAIGQEDYVCLCVNQSPKTDCTPACRTMNETGRYGNYEWPESFAGEKVNITCVHGTLSTAKTEHAWKTCVSSNTWAATDYRDCSELGLLEATRKLNELKDLTTDATALNADDVSNYTTILEQVFAYAFIEQKIAESVIQVVSNLVDVNLSVTVESNAKNRTSERMFDLLNKYTAGVRSDRTMILSTTNIHLAAVDVDEDDVENGVGFSLELLDGNQTTDGGISISVPREVLQTTTDAQRYPTRLQFIGFRRSSFFIPSNANLDDIQEQRVISASVKDRRLVGLSQPVIYKVKNTQVGRNVSCVYWDVSKQSWSREGIVTLKKENNTECHSSHLTSFAILMDPNPTSEKLPVIHEEILSYISYIGCAISLMSLVLTMLTYGMFRSLRNEKSGKILLNLCVAMTLMNVSFLMGSQSSRYGDGLCMTVAVLLHYFLLATFMWMLVEALEMYRALVTVFAKYARFYMVKRCVGAWGVPLIIVGITLGIDTGHYRSTRDFCFISEGSQVAYYTSLLAPCCLVLLTNTIVFILVSRVIIKPRFQHSLKGEGSVTPAQFRGAFTVMILLGVTWVFGPLAIAGGAKIVFNYLFCILNSLQGFLIFVFRCVFNPEARLCWIQLIKTGTLKRKRGPIKSVYSDYSSKGDNSKSRHTTSYVNAGTLKTNIVHSNGWHPQLNGMPHENGKPSKHSEMFTFDINSKECDSFTTKADIYLENHTPPKRFGKDMEDCSTHL